MQLNNVIVHSSVPSNALRGSSHYLHPGEWGSEGCPGISCGAEAVELPDGLLQLVSVEDVPEAP